MVRHQRGWLKTAGKFLGKFARKFARGGGGNPLFTAAGNAIGQSFANRKRRASSPAPSRISKKRRLIKKGRKGTRRSNGGLGGGRLSKDLQYGREQRRVATNSKFRKAVFNCIQPPIQYEFVDPRTLTAAISLCSWATIQLSSVIDNAGCHNALINSYLMTPTAATAIAAKSITNAYVNSAHMESRIMNATNAVAYLRIYHCRARHDIPVSVTSNTSVLGLVQNGFASSTTPTYYSFPVPNITYDNPECTLYQNHEFCTLYDIKSVKRIELNAGESFILESNNGGYKLDLAYRANNTDYLDNTSSDLLVIQLWGQLGAGHGLTKDSTHVNTCEAKIDWIEKRMYNLSIAPGYSGPMNSLQSSMGTAPAAMDFFEDLTGVVTAQSDL